MTKRKVVKLMLTVNMLCVWFTLNGGDELTNYG